MFCNNTNKNSCYAIRCYASNACIQNFCTQPAFSPVYCKICNPPLCSFTSVPCLNQLARPTLGNTLCNNTVKKNAPFYTPTTLNFLSRFIEHECKKITEKNQYEKIIENESKKDSMKEFDFLSNTTLTNLKSESEIETPNSKSTKKKVERSTKAENDFNDQIQIFINNSEVHSTKSSHRSNKSDKSVKKLEKATSEKNKKTQSYQINQKLSKSGKNVSPDLLKTKSILKKQKTKKSSNLLIPHLFTSPKSLSGKSQTAKSVNYYKNSWSIRKDKPKKKKTDDKTDVVLNLVHDYIFKVFEKMEQNF